jgi:hypothetical protein
VYALYHAYQSRNVGSFFWGVGCALVILAIYARILKNTLIILISIVATLAIVENALGLIQNLQKNTGNGPFAYFDSAQTYNTPSYWHLGPFGLQPKPGAFTAIKMAAPNKPVYDVVFTIGSDGFRITPKYGSDSSQFVNGNQADIQLVNFFGDSFTFGEGVQDNETMPYYFAALRNQKSLPIFVKNYGVHGWGMQQALAIIQSPIQKNANLQFALTAPWHASRSACADSFSLGSPKYKLLANGLVERDGYCRSFGWVERSPKAIRGLITKSNIFNLVQDSLLVTKEQDEQVRLYLGILKTMEKELTAKGQRLVIGFIKADDNWFKGSYTNEKILSQIKDMGIAVIDMTLANKNENIDPALYIHELDKHPSGAGHKARAKLLVDYLDQSK